MKGDRDRAAAGQSRFRGGGSRHGEANQPAGGPAGFQQVGELLGQSLAGEGPEHLARPLARGADGQHLGRPAAGKSGELDGVGYGHPLPFSQPGGHCARDRLGLHGAQTMTTTRDQPADQASVLSVTFLGGS